LLLQRPDKLTLVTGELWPSQRLLAEEADKDTVPGESVMEGVEHIGQYVFEMTTTRIKQLRQERGESVEEVPAVEEVVSQVEGLGYEDQELVDQRAEEEQAQEAVRVEGFEAEEDD
jgi:intron-binding protein aquarius